MKKDFRETSKTGAVAWLLQRVSAVILFVILIYHFAVYHILARGNPPAWNEVVAKMQSPWFALLQFVFLTTALYHGLNGAWMVVEDYIHSRYLRLFIFSLIVLAAVALLFIGTLNIFKMASFKPGV